MSISAMVRSGLRGKTSKPRLLFDICAGPFLWNQDLGHKHIHLDCHTQLSSREEVTVRSPNPCLASLATTLFL